MRFLSKSKKEVEKEIAYTILTQEDRIATLFNVISNLPEGLVDWFRSRLKQQEFSPYYVEIDIARGIRSPIILPGDIVITKNRDPKPGDIIEIAMRNDENYWTDTLKITKVHVKDGFVNAHSVSNPENKGNINMGNVLCIIDKVIKYEDPEWKRLIEILNIQVDMDEIENWVKGSIKELESSKNFHDRTNNLNKLNARLKALKKQ